MSFLKNDIINVDNDISIIDPEMEKKPKLTIAGEILEDAIFSHISISFTIILEGLNLIFIGHLPGGLKYFSKFQIGVVYIYLFGLIYSLGMIKSLKYSPDRHSQYINYKVIIYFLSLFLITPFAGLSYKILFWLYNDESFWMISCDFIFYSPLFSFFYLMFHLNLILFQRNGIRAYVGWFAFLFIFIHSLLSYVLLFQFHFAIKGITLSLTLTSFICYIISNMTIGEELNEKKGIKNFYFIPNKIQLDALAESSYNGLSNILWLFLDYLPFGFFLLFSNFIPGQTSIFTNIIMLNLFTLLHSFSQGLSSTLKNYISYSSTGNKHSHQAKVKYVKIFTLVVLAFAITFSVILLTLRGDITRLYLSSAEVSSEFSSMNRFYTVIIFADFISGELEGYVRGITLSQNNLFVYKVLFPIIFIPVGFSISFFFEYGLYGIWIGIFLLVLFYMFPNAVNVFRDYDAFFRR